MEILFEIFEEFKLAKYTDENSDLISFHLEQHRVIEYVFHNFLQFRVLERLYRSGQLDISTLMNYIWKARKTRRFNAKKLMILFPDLYLKNSEFKKMIDDLNTSSHVIDGKFITSLPNFFENISTSKTIYANSVEEVIIYKHDAFPIGNTIMFDDDTLMPTHEDIEWRFDDILINSVPRLIAKYNAIKCFRKLKTITHDLIKCLVEHNRKEMIQELYENLDSNPNGNQLLFTILMSAIKYKNEDIFTKYIDTLKNNENLIVASVKYRFPLAISYFGTKALKYLERNTHYYPCIDELEKQIKQILPATICRCEVNMELNNAFKHLEKDSDLQNIIQYIDVHRYDIPYSKTIGLYSVTYNDNNLKITKNNDIIYYDETHKVPDIEIVTGVVERFIDSLKYTILPFDEEIKVLRESVEISTHHPGEKSNVSISCHDTHQNILIYHLYSDNFSWLY